MITMAPKMVYISFAPFPVATVRNQNELDAFANLFGEEYGLIDEGGCRLVAEFAALQDGATYFFKKEEDEPVVPATPTAEAVAKSGLKYSSESNSIWFGEHDDRRLELHDAVSPYISCPNSYQNETISKAFEYVDENSGTIEDGFLDTMIKHLDKRLVKYGMNAVSFGEIQHPDGHIYGEMYLQQIVYSPFAALFAAATDVAERSFHYAADEEVTSSVYVDHRNNERDEFSRGSIAMKPDAAVTLGAKCDAFGMMEIKALMANNRACKIDRDRCVLMTAATAIILCRLLDKTLHDMVALPFVIATGFHFGLFVTTLTKYGSPRVSFVNLGGSQGTFVTIESRMSPDVVRSKMFVALAILLDNARALLSEDLLKQYNKTFVRTKQVVAACDKIFSATSKRKSAETEASSAHGRRSSRGMPNSRNNEREAMQAASCQGRFMDLRCAVMHNVFGSEEERHPPYYFVGHETSTKQAAFLKVWPSVAEEKLSRRVHKELEFQTTAHAVLEAAVARPLDRDVILVQSATGSSYMMIAMEYIRSVQPIGTMDEMVAFSVSLIDTVQKLHSKASVLHCDLSPSNVLWNKGRVVLVDFGRAQHIHEAVSEYGTKGFEAPEISDDKPHSRSTDAFSVGKIILFFLNAHETYLKEHGADLKVMENDLQAAAPDCATIELLSSVAFGLTKADPNERWGLTQALNSLTRNPVTNVRRFDDDFKSDPFGPAPPFDDGPDPPSKIAKHSVTISGENRMHNATAPTLIEIAPQPYNKV